MAKLEAIQTKHRDGSVTFTPRPKPETLTLETKLTQMATRYRRRIDGAIEDANDTLNAELTDLCDADEYSVEAVWDAIEAMDDSINVEKYEIVSSLTEAAEYTLDRCEVAETSDELDMVECERTARDCLNRSKDKLIEMYDGGYWWLVPEGSGGLDDIEHEEAALAMEN